MGAAAVAEPTMANGEQTVLGEAARAAQEAWARRGIRDRLRVLRAARHGMAERTKAFCAAISPELARAPADTLVAEVLPLLDACRFLERQAEKILATRRLGRRGLPLWLAGIDSEVQRVALGQVLVIGPTNYPLFVPGVQTLQALAAGNAVVWKPARGGRAAAEVFAAAMHDAGLPSDLLTVTDETVEAGRAALHGEIDGVVPAKVVLTGSHETGRAVLRELAETLTPCVAELSGCDAVVVLPSADLARVAKAMAFGMRLNGSATCMAPRRLLLAATAAARREELIGGLAMAFAEIDVRLPATAARRLEELLEDAVGQGAHVHGERDAKQRPILVTNVSPEMQIAQADIFAPVLSVIEVRDEAELLLVERHCQFGLTAAIFGEEREARALGAKMNVGTVLVNDVIVPTADPRVPFGGRRQSGFGATRGAEGLLDMTAAKTVVVRRGRGMRHYGPAGARHEELFDGMILAGHARTLRLRLQGWKRAIAAARGLR